MVPFRKVYQGLILLALLVLPAAYGLTENSFSKSSKRCIQKMRQLEKACREYAQKNKGSFPPDLKTLFPEYLKDERVLHCSAYTDEKYEYVYVPGTTSDSPGNCIVLVDTVDSHLGKGRFIITADSSRIWMEEVEFRDYLKEILSTSLRRNYTDQGLLALAETLDRIKPRKPLPLIEEITNYSPYIFLAFNILFLTGLYAGSLFLIQRGI